MTYTIRPFTSDDYTALIAVANAVQPEHVITEEQLRHIDANRDPKCKIARWVAEQNGQIVGYSVYSQHADMYHPQKFWVTVRVLPIRQRQGIGTALYNTMLEGVRAHHPIALQIQLREDHETPLRFATQHGFAEFGRRWESILDVTTFDSAPHQAALDTVASQGITLRSIAELAADPDRDRKLYELQWSAELDVPTPEPVTPMTFEQYCKEMLNSPHLVAEGSFVAVDDSANGRYVGLSIFFSGNDDVLEIDMTGVLTAYRRRGIALAIKLRGIQWAQENGFKQISVVNDTVNVGMLAINERLGFLRQPALLWMQKTFDATK